MKICARPLHTRACMVLEAPLPVAYVGHGEKAILVSCENESGHGFPCEGRKCKTPFAPVFVDDLQIVGAICATRVNKLLGLVRAGKSRDAGATFRTMSARNRRGPPPAPYMSARSRAFPAMAAPS